MPLRVVQLFYNSKGNSWGQVREEEPESKVSPYRESTIYPISFTFLKLNSIRYRKPYAK